MARTIAFVGNCQMLALKNLYDTFAGGHTQDKTIFVSSFEEAEETSRRELEEVAVVVQQVQSLEPQVALPDELRSAERYFVPLVAASFLWPFAGEQHPLNTDDPHLKGGPYPGELGDSFLNRLIHQGVSADDAPDLYRDAQLSDNALERRFELVIDRQRRRDEICGFSIAAEIEKHFRAEPLFFSPHHPGVRIFRSLAVQCFKRIGAPAGSLDLLTTHMRRSPFPQDQAPIHPAVARYFKLRYINTETTYAFRGEGQFAWEQWVDRYMRYSWDQALYEAAAIAEANPARAKDLLTGVLHRLPQSPLAHLSLAKALSKLGDAERAAAEAEKAIALDSCDPAAWRAAAMIAMQRNRYEEARRFAASAVANDPSNIDNIGLLAKIQEDLRDFSSAELSRRVVTFFVPHVSQYRDALGTTLIHQDGREQESYAEYRRAIALDPENAGAHFGASIVLARFGRNEEAIEAVQSAINLDPAAPLYHSHLGHLLGRLGRLKEAIAAFSRVLEFEPENAGIHNVISNMMMREQQRERALWHMRRAVEIEPRTPSFLITYSQMLVDCNRISEAITPLSQALAVRPDDASLRLRLGMLLAQGQRLDEAARELIEASRIDLQDTEAPYELSRVLEQMGDLVGAETAIARALALRPTDEKLIRQQQNLIDLRQATRYMRVPAHYLMQTSEVIVPAMQVVTPKCLVLTNFEEVNPEFARHHLDGLYIERQRHLPAISVGRIDSSVRLVVPTGEDFIPFIGNKVVADQVRPNWDDKELDHLRCKSWGEASIEGPAVLIGRYGIRTWGHWLGELLPKVMAVEAAMPNRFRYILPEKIVTDPHHRTALESLEFYGVGRDRLSLVSPETTYSVSDLHVVTPVWSPDHMIHPMVAELMRTHGPNAREPAAGPERVALLRREARTRKLANLEDVQQLLEQRGWSILDLEGMSFRDQVNLFRSAKSIVSVLGSGLTGLMYSPPGVRIMTFAPSHWGDLFFFALMQERNAALIDIRGPSTAATPGDVATASFAVDLHEVERGLTAFEKMAPAQAG